MDRHVYNVFLVGKYSLMGSKNSYPKYIVAPVFFSFLSFLFLLYSDLGSTRVPKKAWAPGAVVNGANGSDTWDPGTGDAVQAHRLKSQVAVQDHSTTSSSPLPGIITSSFPLLINTT
jgi:hypothetical protein